MNHEIEIDGDYRLLDGNEVIEKGDFVFDGAFWRGVGGSTGDRVDLWPEYTFARRKKPTAEPPVVFIDVPLGYYEFDRNEAIQKEDLCKWQQGLFTETLSKWNSVGYASIGTIPNSWENYRFIRAIPKIFGERILTSKKIKELLDVS